MKLFRVLHGGLIGYNNIAYLAPFENHYALEAWERMTTAGFNPTRNLTGYIDRDKMIRFLRAYRGIRGIQPCS